MTCATAYSINIFKPVGGINDDEQAQLSNFL